MMEIRKAVSRLLKSKGIIEFDFDQAWGDTIREKIESFCLFIGTHFEIKDISFVVTSPEISALFEVSCLGFKPMGTWSFPHQETLTLINDRFMGFEIFKSPKMARDEFVMFGKKETVIVKFINFVI